MPQDAELRGQLMELGGVLSDRAAEHERLVPYDEGGCPIPDAIVRGRMTRAYRSLMPQAEAPWGSLIIDAKLDRLEVAGFDDGDKAKNAKAWKLWQENAMDAESKLAHRAALLDGRAFALVWPDGDTGRPAISLDDATQMVVKYEPGSRRKRVAALRRFVEDGRVKATLYRSDGVFKYQATNTDGQVPSGVMGWEKRAEKDGSWGLPNPYKVVPVVEIAVNRKLKPGSFGYARGEYAHCTGLMDRINLLTFLGLVVAVWMGFPLRGVLGEKLIKDDDGKVVPPFDSRPDSVFQIENPDAKMYEFKAADRSNLSVFAELEQLAVISKTPRHYFPMESGISNIATETIMAYEGGMHAANTGHKASLGEGWEEVERIGGVQLEPKLELSPTAETRWKDGEARSLAERADAASKLKDILPQAAIIERVLNETPEAAMRYAAQGAFSEILDAAKEPAPVPVVNGASANGVPTN